VASALIRVVSTSKAVSYLGSSAKEAASVMLSNRLEKVLLLGFAGASPGSSWIEGNTSLEGTILGSYRFPAP